MWFPSLFGPRHSGLLPKRSGGPAGRRRPARRLLLEVLEDRSLLTNGGAAALVAGILPGSAGSNPAAAVAGSGSTLGPLVQVSGPSPFAACHPPLLNAETETTV